MATVFISAFVHFLCYAFHNIFWCHDIGNGTEWTPSLVKYYVQIILF